MPMTDSLNDKATVTEEIELEAEELEEVVAPHIMPNHNETPVSEEVELEGEELEEVIAPVWEAEILPM